MNQRNFFLQHQYLGQTIFYCCENQIVEATKRFVPVKKYTVVSISTNTFVRTKKAFFQSDASEIFDLIYTYCNKKHCIVQRSCAIF